MATFNMFNRLTEDLAEKVHNFASDTLKLYLTNTTPVATNTQFGSPPEITATNGYVACGLTITVSSSGQSSGTYKLDVGTCDPQFKSAGGGFGPFRYVVWYNASASGALIGWWDYNCSISLVSDGETFTAVITDANGILQIAPA